MAWDFETDPDYQKKLDWVDQFVREEVEPLDLAFPHLQFTPLEGKRREAVLALEEKNFHPLMTHSSPSFSARVLNSVGSAPAWGSVME